MTLVLYSKTEENLNDNCLVLPIHHSATFPTFFCVNTVDFLLDHISKSLIVKFYTFFCRHRFVSKCIKTYVLYMRLY